MEYLFKTDTCMKPYNYKKWWIARDYVDEIVVEADNIDSAVRAFAEEVASDTCLEISKNAIKHKQPMYKDYKDGSTKQVGYVITGSTLIRDDEAGEWKRQFVDLWVEIMNISDCFEEV